MVTSYEEKVKGALLGVAIGDAYGWPNEQNSHRVGNNRYDKIDFQDWVRKDGGRFWPHEECIKAGEYSDDTQLTLATLRALLLGKQWGQQFIYTELPVWSVYARGAGGATKRAAAHWEKGKSPWKISSPGAKQYFNAGGNGAAMRVLPHAFDLNLGHYEFIEQVFINSMYTHGHPRAIIGAMLYATAVRYLLQKSDTLEYGGLVRYLSENVSLWNDIPHNDKIKTWIDSAIKLGIDYQLLWQDTIYETKELLEKAEVFLSDGLLDVTEESLEKLGCFNRKINGAGNITAVTALYMFSKYADSPVKSITLTGTLNKADTDTLASMVGGLVGALHGTFWIPEQWKKVQDYHAIEFLAETYLKKERIKIDSSSREIRLTKAIVDKMNIGDAGSFEPFGEVVLVNREQFYGNSSNTIVIYSQLKTYYGQTLYVKRMHRNGTEDIGYNKPKVDTKLSVSDLEFINRILVNKWTAGDLISLIKEIDINCYNNTFDNRFTDMCCKEWKIYDLTPSQLKRIKDILTRKMGEWS